MNHTKMCIYINLHTMYTHTHTHTHMHKSSRICNIVASKFRVGRSERTIHKYKQNDEGSA